MTRHSARSDHRRGPPLCPRRLWFLPAHGEGDDILIGLTHGRLGCRCCAADRQPAGRGDRLLRRRVAPGRRPPRWVRRGDAGTEELAATYQADRDDSQWLVKALADRLGGVRRSPSTSRPSADWYGSDADPTVEDLHAGDRGIRPAFGYPRPKHSVKRPLFGLLGAEQLGLTLDPCAMTPGEHPRVAWPLASRYFQPSDASARTRPRTMPAGEAYDLTEAIGCTPTWPTVPVSHGTSQSGGGQPRL